MTSRWKTVAVVACVAVLCGAAITWQVWSAKSNERRLTEAAKACGVRAVQGDAKAETELAYMYSHGQGVPQSYDEALRWRHKAADQGYAGGERGLGYMYLYGQGVPRDYAEALRWFRKAADQGDAKGQTEVANMYEEGLGVRQDYAETLRWYHKAVDQGYSVAQSNLGDMYYYGRGVPRDYATAIYWYQRAANQGDDYAQRVLHIKWKGMSTCRKISMATMFLGCLWCLIGSLTPVGKYRDEQQRTFMLAGLVGLSYVAFELLGFRYIGILTPTSAILAFRFVNGLWLGATLTLLFGGVLTSKVWRMVVNIHLGFFGILLIGLDVFVISISKMRRVSPTLGHFWPINAHLLGMICSLAIAFWLASKRRIETEPKCEVAASESPTEINEDGT